MGFEEDTYTTIFKAMQHPIRRRILRAISEKPSSYSEIQRELNIDNGLLNYHLEALSSLITKNSDEKYTLSDFGRATVSLVNGVEEPAHLSHNRQVGALKRISTIMVILLVSIAVLGVATGYLFLINMDQQRRVTEVSHDILANDVWIEGSQLINVMNRFVDSGVIDVNNKNLADIYSVQMAMSFSRLMELDPERYDQWSTLRTSTLNVGGSLSGLDYWLIPMNLTQEQHALMSDIVGDLRSIQKIADAAYPYTSTDTHMNVDDNTMKAALDAAGRMRNSLNEFFGSYLSYQSQPK